LGTFLRWTAGVTALFLALTAVEWAMTELLPAVLPFLLVGALVVAVVWTVHRLR
jgi:hypothetical protein